MDYISFSRRFFAATGVPVTLPERVFIIFQADADISLPASFHRVPGIDIIIWFCHHASEVHQGKLSND